MKYISKDFDTLRDALEAWGELGSKLSPTYSYSKKGKRHSKGAAQLAVEVNGNNHAEFEKVRLPMDFKPI